MFNLMYVLTHIKVLKFMSCLCKHSGIYSVVMNEVVGIFVHLLLRFIASAAIPSHQH